MNNGAKLNKPRILLFDIETAPSLGAYFELYREGNIVWAEKDWYILCFVAKWLDSKEVITSALPDYPLYKRNREDDKQVVKALWKLLNEADIVVAHNGDQFDIKKSNARFIEHGLKPPKPYKSIDTKKIAKQYFRFDSNKLDELGRHLGLGRKLQTGGHKLWQDCIKGDKKAWRKMVEYNIQDVKLLEKVYLKFLPWIQNHPNFNVYVGSENKCPNCGSKQLMRQGHAYSATGVFQQFNCKKCGRWSRKPMNNRPVR